MKVVIWPFITLAVVLGLYMVTDTVVSIYLREYLQGKTNKRIEEVEEFANQVYEGMLVRDLRGRERDSVYYSELGSIENRLMRLDSTRVFSLLKAKEMEDSIRVAQVRRDSIAKRLMEW